MTRVLFRPDAEADLSAIAVHVAKHSKSRARALVQRLQARCLVLVAHPLAGRPRPELGEDLRSLSDRPYVLVYRLVGNDVEVIAILHGARDLPAALAARINKDKP